MPAGVSGPTCAVVIPAHNEETVVGRCLATLLGDVRPGEFEVLVISNGSSDRTVEVALARAAELDAGVQVIDLAVASKIAAVREGIARAGAGSVIVLDADIELPSASARSIASALARPDATVASARLEMDTSRASWAVRRYYRAWQALPYATAGMVGSGVFGLNAAALEQMGELPPITNDDGWVRRSFPAEQRVVVSEPFTAHAARTARALVARRARIMVGNRELDARLGQRDAGRNGGRALVHGIRAGELAVVDALVFLILTAASRGAALVRVVRKDTRWSTDHTSRIAE